MRNPAFILALSAIVVAGVLLAVAGRPTAPDVRQQMPAHIRNAPAHVSDAYEYAATHMEELAKHPCYCGCVIMNHTSALSCFVADVAPNGAITWDNHALGCGICVDTALDVQRLKAQGWASPAIRDYVDATYGHDFGPGTDTPYPVS